ncbi:MAG: hypothetical protein J2P17_33775, partial [Mycobacterium sp.]|nr:hypothetical protein [Mycobacterium sp.]
IARTSPDPVLKSFRDGLAYTLRHRLVLAMACSEATYFLFWSMTEAVLIIFLARQLQVAPALIGLIFTIGTLGGLVGAATARPIATKIGIGRSLIIGNTLRSVGMVLTPLVALLATGPGAGTITGLMAARVINAYGWSVWDVNRETMQQSVISDQMRGRVTGSVLFMSRRNDGHRLSRCRGSRQPPRRPRNTDHRRRRNAAGNRMAASARCHPCGHDVDPFIMIHTSRFGSHDRVDLARRHIGERQSPRVQDPDATFRDALLRVAINRWHQLRQPVRHCPPVHPWPIAMVVVAVNMQPRLDRLDQTRQLW